MASVTVTRTEGVTVLTLVSDPEMACPPLCQVLLGFCYNPLCCSVSPRLKRILVGSQPVLAALHIMTGLLSVGLATILCNSPGALWWQDDYTAFPFWMSGVFVSFGIMCILSEKFPSPCLVIINVILQLSGVFFAIVAIVLYSINIVSINLWELCEPHIYDYDDNHTDSTTTLSPSINQCLESRVLIMMLLRSINAVLIVLCVLELCVTISCSVIGIKALRKLRKDKQQSSEAVVNYQPVVA